MTPKLFVEGGYQWSAVPPISILPWSRARHLWEHLIEKVRDAGDAIVLRTRDIAHELGVSMRYVQYAIRDLVDAGFLSERTEREALKNGRIVFKRILTMLQRPAGKAPKAKQATVLASKNFSAPSERPCVDPRTTVRRPLLFEEESEGKKTQAPGGGESDGTDPPPGLGSGAPPAEAAVDPTAEAEAAADPLAVMLAAAAQVAPPPSASPERPGAPGEPEKTPTPRRDAPRPRLTPAEALAERKRRAEPLARSGDKAAIAEMAEIERAERALADRGPAPPALPPAEPVEPPKSDRPRTIWEKLTPWSSRRKRE